METVYIPTLIPLILAGLARYLRGPWAVMERAGTDRHGNPTYKAACNPWYRDLGWGLCPDDFLLLCIWSIVGVAALYSGGLVSWLAG